MVIKSTELDTRVAGAANTEQIFPIDDLRDVIIEGKNTDDTNSLNWSVWAWRVPKISRIDSGRERHPTSIPSTATQILGVTVIATEVSGTPQKLTNGLSFTHAGIRIIKGIEDDATSFIGKYSGRYDSH